MTDEYLKDNIEARKGVFTWIGPKTEVMFARKHLMNHWLKCAGKPATEETIYNMSKDQLCVDRRFLTTDPDNWEAPKKKVKKTA